MTQATETKPSATAQPEESLQANSQSFITMGTAVVLCVLTTLITLMIVAYGPAIAQKQGFKLPGAGHLTGSKIVYLDFEKVLSAGMEGVVDGQSSMEEVTGKANKFQAEIKRVISSYTDSGYTVINAKALIQGAADDDITTDVIQQVMGGK